MNSKSFEQRGTRNPKNTSPPNQPQAGLSTASQQFLVALLTTQHVATQLRTCVHSVRRLTKRGLLPAVRFSNRLIRYRQEDVNQYIASAVTRGTAGGA